MPVAGVVDALERIHAALTDDGLLVDTQPVSARPPVVSERDRLGALDMTDWATTIAAVDGQIARAFERGLFTVTTERAIVVVDVFDDLTELIAATGEWEGTRVPEELARCAETERGPVKVEQDIRLRVLARR